MDFFPEIAPRLRIDTRRRFVEQQQFRLVQHAGGKRETLFPAARQFTGKLVGAFLKAEAFERGGDISPAVGDVVHTSDEVQVLADGQVFPVGEALGHVADFALDAVGLCQHVVAETGALRRHRA